jgi:ABC-2 type transport system permease protein
VVQAIFLLISGVYYPIEVLPAGLQPLARVSPATYVLEGMRAAILEGSPVTELWPFIWPLLVAGVVAIPVGLRIFGMGEHYAKRTGKLKRNG